MICTKKARTGDQYHARNILAHLRDALLLNMLSTVSTTSFCFAFFCLQRQCLGLLTRFGGSERLRQFKLQDDPVEGDRVSKRDEIELAMQQVRQYRSHSSTPSKRVTSLCGCAIILNDSHHDSSDDTYVLLWISVNPPSLPSSSVDLCQCDGVLPITYGSVCAHF